MEHIKETLAKNQPVPSQTLTDKIVCSCGAPATPPYKLCRTCLEEREKASQENEKLELEKQLKITISNQELKWYDDANIPNKFAFKTFDNFDSKLQPKAVEAIKKLHWARDDELDLPSKSLTLLSPGIYGLGKTHLVCALITHIITSEEKARVVDNPYPCIKKYPCPVYFNSENELLRRLRYTFNRSQNDELRQETEEDVYESLKRFALLIIDDVGKVKPRDINFLQSVYFNIIDQRYNDLTAMILTTNLNLDDLESHIGGACADRLREMCGKQGFVKMSGKSYRQK